MRPSSERRKYYNASLHQKKRYVRATLSKELRVTEKKRSTTITKGDKVKIMRGLNIGKEAKVARVDHQKMKVYLEGISKKTARGREMTIAFQPSNLMITNLTERKTSKKKVK